MINMVFQIASLEAGRLQASLKARVLRSLTWLPGSQHPLPTYGVRTLDSLIESWTFGWDSYKISVETLQQSQAKRPRTALNPTAPNPKPPNPKSKNPKPLNPDTLNPKPQIEAS